MQIHEITRRNISEGPLKNVASTPVNFGRTTVAMPQQSVAPSKVSYAPNMMPKAAPAAAPGTNLAVVPQTTALAKAPSTGVATTPAGGAVTAAPKPGQVAQVTPAASKSNQSDPNVIDVDAKDITNRQALPAPAAAPAPAANPGGLTPADVEKLKAQDKSNPQTRTAAQYAPTQPDTSYKFKTVKGAQAPATAAPGKAGFVRNAAEYFANKTLNKAGIPIDQQGQYHPGGHMAARLGQGTTAIAQAEQKIAYNLAQEYVNQGTLNRNKTQLTPAAIQSAAGLINQAGNNLQLNFDNITKLTQHYAQEIAKYKKAQKEKQAQGQLDIEHLKDQLRVAEKAKRFKQVQQLSNELKRRGLSDNDINQLRANAVTDVKNNFKNNLNKMTTGAQKSAAAPAMSVGRGQKPGDPNDPAIAQLLATAKKQGKI